MDTQNIENARTDVNNRKVLRTTRCRRAALSNVTNTENNPVVLKKPKKSLPHCPKQEPLPPINKDSYTEDIIKHLLTMEDGMKVCVNYMDKQPDLKPAMRPILIDWIIQACTKFKFADETQYYTVQYIDRFLSSELIERANLQLVGITAIFVAAKFEEVSVPSMRDLCYITEDSYIPKELERMEVRMLKSLDYDLGFPTSLQFLRYLAKNLSCSRHQYYCAKFICEGMSLSYHALRWKPSVIAVSALDILNKVSTYIPIMRQLHLHVDELSVNECKQFVIDTILNDDLKDHVTVFKKYENIYGKLKAVLKSIQV